MSENALYLPFLLLGLHAACGPTPGEKKPLPVVQPAPAQQMPTSSANAYARKSGGAAK